MKIDKTLAHDRSGPQELAEDREPDDDDDGGQNGEDDNEVNHRGKCKMSPHQIWKFIQDSKRTGVSLEKLAEVRERDDHGGVKMKSVPFWSRKLLSMYRQQSRLSFFNVIKICLCTDGITHNCQDFLVTTAYHCSEATETSAYCTSQHINSAKVLYPGQMPLTEEVERLAARRQIDRLAAMKFLQALSAQLAQLSQNALALSSFEPQGDLALQLRPLQPGDLRSFNGTGFQILFKDSMEPFPVTVNDEALAEIPVLKVLMDQGKVGVAASAFCQALGMLIKWDYDKIHRLCRDLKKMSFRLEQCVLACTYMWSINYKPFGSGMFFDEKRNALSAFFESHSQDS